MLLLALTPQMYNMSLIYYISVAIINILTFTQLSKDSTTEIFVGLSCVYTNFYMFLTLAVARHIKKTHLPIAQHVKNTPN